MSLSCTVFYAQDAILTLVLCLSVTSQCSMVRMDELICFFDMGGGLRLTSHTLCFKDIQLSTKIMVLPSGTLPKPGTGKISPRHTESVINLACERWTVKMLRRPFIFAALYNNC